MLNIKKGLAVALAAVTAFTFAPATAFAGTHIQTSSETPSGLKVTMNEAANIWSYDVSTVSGASASLSQEQSAVVVLTPSNPEGSVTFTQAVTDKDTYSESKWYNVTSTGATATTDNKESEGNLQITASKKSKTLNIKASVTYLRQLKGATKLEISRTQFNDLNSGVKVTVIFTDHAVKMNRLKVTLKNAGDSAYNRYTTADKDVYDSKEARPSGVTTDNKDLTTNDDIDVALDGDAITTVKMNLADASKDQAFTVDTNADVTYKSDDTNVATIDKDGIHAKAVGNTTVKITTKQTLNAYGEVTVTIPVEVINKPTATLTAPDDLYVHGYELANAVTIGASGQNIQKNSIKYTFVYWDAASQKFLDFSKDAGSATSYLNPYVLDTASDKVYVREYTGKKSENYNWGAYLKVEATGADGYKDPSPKYIRLHFNNDAPFELDSTLQKLHVGESVQITTKATSAVTGGAFTYKSWNPAVATVSDKGVIKAVSEGSTRIDVTYGGYTKSVSVTVKAYENGKGSAVKPAKVTGVKVTNVKGGKVKVTWTKDSEANVKYYVKKTINGKSAGKSVGSNKTTLSVKKGATVKVKVKAYVYDESGNKLVGTYSKTVTKKTDKK